MGIGPGGDPLRPPRRRLVVPDASATIAVCLAALGVLSQLAPIAAVLVVMAACAAVTNIHLASWVQARVDLAVRGRVLSVLMLSAVGLQPLSLVAAGLLAAWSLRGMFVVAAAALLTITIVGATRSSVRAIA